jgi:hypothetical protein
MNDYAKTYSTPASKRRRSSSSEQSKTGEECSAEPSSFSCAASHEDVRPLAKAKRKRPSDAVVTAYTPTRTPEETIELVDIDIDNPIHDNRISDSCRDSSGGDAVEGVMELKDDLLLFDDKDFSDGALDEDTEDHVIETSCASPSASAGASAGSRSVATAATNPLHSRCPTAPNEAQIILTSEVRPATGCVSEERPACLVGVFDVATQTESMQMEGWPKGTKLISVKSNAESANVRTSASTAAAVPVPIDAIMDLMTTATAPASKDQSSIDTKVSISSNIINFEGGGQTTAGAVTLGKANTLEQRSLDTSMPSLSTFTPSLDTFTPSLSLSMPMETVPIREVFKVRTVDDIYAKAQAVVCSNREKNFTPLAAAPAIQLGLAAVLTTSTAVPAAAATSNHSAPAPTASQLLLTGAGAPFKFNPFTAHHAGSAVSPLFAPPLLPSIASLSSSNNIDSKLLISEINQLL